MPYSWGPAPGVQAAEALVEAPAANAERTARTAQAGALTDAAKASQQDTAMKVLQNHERLIQARPDLAESPMMKQALNAAFGRIGMPVPLDPNGHVDVAALRQLTNPQKTFEELTAKEKSDELALAPEMRGSHAGQPASFATAPARTQMTPVAETALYSSIAQTAKLVGEGHEKPAMLLSSVLAAKARLAAHGMDTSAVDQYLSPDGTGLSDTLRDQLVGQMTDATIQKMQTLTGVAVDRETLRAQIEKDALAKFNRQAGQTDRRLDQRDRSLTLSERRAIDQENNMASLATRRAAETEQGWRRISDNQTFHAMAEGRSMNRFATQALTNQYKAVNDTYNHARTQLEANLRAIAGGAHSADLLSSTEDLKRIVNEVGPQVEALQTKITQQPAVNLQLVTGHKATVTGGTPAGGATPGRQTSTSKSGKPIYSDDGGRTWQYQQ